MIYYSFFVLLSQHKKHKFNKNERKRSKKVKTQYSNKGNICVPKASKKKVKQIKKSKKSKKDCEKDILNMFLKYCSSKGIQLTKVNTTESFSEMPSIGPIRGDDISIEDFIDMENNIKNITKSSIFEEEEETYQSIDWGLKKNWSKSQNSSIEPEIRKFE